jgi:hypothetical protein
MFQFCQPGGWALSTKRMQPTYFVSVLTDIDAERHYCACLTFNELVAKTPKKQNEDIEDPNAPVQHSLFYAPKTLVLISRLDYFETFRVGMKYCVQRNVKINYRTSQLTSNTIVLHTNLARLVPRYFLRFCRFLGLIFNNIIFSDKPHKLYIFVKRIESTGRRCPATGR